jgi:hypothetical protein
MELFAKWVLRDLVRMTGGGRLRSVIIPVSGLKIEFPPDMLNLSKVGFIDEGTGTIVTIRQNDELALSMDVLQDNLGNFVTDSDGDYLLARKDRTTYGSPSTQDWADGGLWVGFDGANSTMYGAPGAQDKFGTFRVVDEKGLIEFSSDIPFSSAVLEYLSDPTITNDPLVDTRLEDAITAGMTWQAIKRKSHVQPIVKREARDEYRAMRRKSHRLMHPVTIKDISSILKQSRRQSRAT